MLSQKALEKAFPTKGKELRQLLTGKRKTEDYETVKKWVKECYNRPSYIERLEKALNEVLKGYGNEAVFSQGSFNYPAFTYVNMGDTYDTTLIRDYDKGRWVISSMGDYIEYKEKKGFQFN